jgi:hypothetical protein
MPGRVDARTRQKDFAMQDNPQRAGARKKTRTLALPTGRASKSDLPQDTDGLQAIAFGGERDRGRR